MDVVWSRPLRFVALLVLTLVLVACSSSASGSKADSKAAAPTSTVPNTSKSQASAIAQLLGCKDFRDVSPGGTIPRKVKPTSSGVCRFNGNFIALDVYKDPKTRAAADLEAQTVLCKGAKLLRLNSFSYVESGEFIVSAPNPAQAKAVAQKIRSKVVTISCP